MNRGKLETMARLSDRMISIEYSLNVIDQISHLIRADKWRNIQFINGAQGLEANLLFPNASGLASGAK
jgi:hypothetical protein